MTNTNMDLDSICASLSCVVSKRSHYQRLHNGAGDRRKVKMIRARRSLGSRSARRFWRIPKLRRLKIASPFKLLTKLKNVYINMMLNFSENLGYMSAANVHLAPKRVPILEGQVESRFVFEIYKALKASDQELEEKCRFG